QDRHGPSGSAPAESAQDGRPADLRLRFGERPRREGAADRDPEIPAGQGRAVPDLRRQPRERRRARGGARARPHGRAGLDRHQRLKLGTPRPFDRAWRGWENGALMGPSRIALLFVICALIVSGTAIAQDSDVFILKEKTPAPAFSLPDLAGQTVTSKALAGKVAVLSFGATWCPTCTSELKSLENLQAKFPNDVVVYFVALDGRGDKDVKPYMERNGNTN